MTFLRTFEYFENLGCVVKIPKSFGRTKPQNKKGWMSDLEGGYRDLARLLGESWCSKKWGAIRGKKIHGNREIVVDWTIGVVGAQGQLTQGAIMRNPRTKYKRSKNVFAVTSIALIIGRDWPRLVQPLAQSLIGSPSTLLSLQVYFERTP